MAEFPRINALPDALVHISSVSQNATGGATGTTTSSSAVWPSANLALFVPFRIARPYTLSTGFYYAGATNTGNFDIGVYSADGTKIVSSGSTLISGTTSALHTVSLTSTELGPGQFYLAIAFNSGSSTVFRWSSPGLPDTAAMGWASQATAFPLPATATFASVIGSGLYIPLFGVTGRSFV